MAEPRILEERTNSRASVIRRAVLLTPAAIVLLILLAFSVTYLPRSIMAVIILSLGAIPASIEAVAAVRDLSAAPITTHGRINRLWKKSRYLVVGRVDYALVGRRLFELQALTAMQLAEGDDVVIEHWPHTNIVVSLTVPPAS